MAVRKRFNATEKPLIVTGAEIEWQLGRYWHPAIILGPIVTDRDGWQSAPMRNLATTRGISPGDYFTATPGHVRARSIVVGTAP